MNPALYSQRATAATARYKAFTDALQGLVFTASLGAGDHDTIGPLKSQALALGSTYLATEKNFIEKALQDTVLNAVHSSQTDVLGKVVSDTTSLPEGFLGVAESFLIGELQGQVTRDIATITKMFKEFVLETHLTSRAKKISLPAASHLISRKFVQRIQFSFRDRAGRLYQSSTFVYSVWRQTLVSLGVDAYCLEASKHGVTKFAVDHPDPNHSLAGLEVDLGDLKSFQDMREKAFHPNSRAKIKAL